MNLPDADEILLGEILNGTVDIAKVVAQFSACDFERSAHKRIFDCMSRLYGHGQPVDRVHVANELMKYNELEVCGGLSYLVKLSDYGEYAHG
jgi:replicative DNA helicase